MRRNDVIKGKIVTASKAPEPMDIKWEFMYVKDIYRVIVSVATSIITFIILLIALLLFIRA